MKNQLANTRKISISNFTFDSKSNTISFFSTKTNKCWSRVAPSDLFDMLHRNVKIANQKTLNKLKKYVKNGHN